MVGFAILHVLHLVSHLFGFGCIWGRRTLFYKKIKITSYNPEGFLVCGRWIGVDCKSVSVGVLVKDLGCKPISSLGFFNCYDIFASNINVGAIGKHRSNGLGFRRKRNPYSFSHLSNQFLNLRCHRIPFCGCNTQ